VARGGNLRLATKQPRPTGRSRAPRGHSGHLRDDPYVLHHRVAKPPVTTKKKSTGSSTCARTEPDVSDDGTIALRHQIMRSGDVTVYSSRPVFVAGSPAIVSCAGVANSCSVHGPRPPSINATPLRPRVPLLHSTTTTWFHFRFLLFSTSGIISPFSSFHSSVQAAPSLLFLNSAAVYTCLLLVWMRSCSLI
jgi:hypothetical protein